MQEKVLKSITTWYILQLLNLNLKTSNNTKKKSGTLKQPKLKAASRKRAKRAPQKANENFAPKHTHTLFAIKLLLNRQYRTIKPQL